MCWENQHESVVQPASSKAGNSKALPHPPFNRIYKSANLFAHIEHMEQSIGLPQASASIDFAIARIEFLNSFADLEAGICEILEKSGTLPNSKEPFGNRLKAFKEVDRVSLVAKCRIGQRNALVEAISKLLPIRADIVHSRMHVNELGDRPVALFVNSQVAFDQDAPARILTLERMQQMTEMLAKFTAKLGELKRPINPASSPPPPSQGEAAGP